MQRLTAQACFGRRGTRRLCLLTLLMALIATFDGCVESPRRRWYTSSCGTDEGCGSDGLCIEGHCAQSCAAQSECDEGFCLKKHCVPQEKVCSYGYCDDGNACTDDDCDAQKLQCSHPLHPGTCSDNDQCTVGDECVLVGGKAACQTAPKCDDGDPATVDTCKDGVCASP